MWPECWTAVRGAFGRDFSIISPKPAPLSGGAGRLSVVARMFDGRVRLDCLDVC